MANIYKDYLQRLIYYLFIVISIGPITIYLSILHYLYCIIILCKQTHLEYDKWINQALCVIVSTRVWASLHWMLSGYENRSNGKEILLAKCSKQHDRIMHETLCLSELHLRWTAGRQGAFRNDVCLLLPVHALQSFISFAFLEDLGCK